MKIRGHNLKRINLFLATMLLTSCSTVTLLDKNTDAAYAKEPTKSESITRIQSAPQKTKVIIKKVYIKGPTRLISSSDPSIEDFALSYDKKHFDFWVKYFTKNKTNHERFIRHQKNGERFREVIEKILAEHNLPKELFYVGLIESGYNTRIRSRANAVGPWQFVKGTATPYGMRVDRSLDERRSIYKATHAAARYFKDLYNIFGSWELALCAYNKGEYGIIRAIRKGNTRDYRELVRKKLLPKETIYYIPKIAAARHIVNNREKYGYPSFTTQKKEGKVYSHASYRTMYKSFNWKKVAKKLGISKRAMLELNPDFKKASIYVSSRNPIEIYIPKKNHIKLAEEIAPNWVKQAADKKYSSSSKSHKKYKVRRGDSFIAIAKRFGIKVNDLLAINRIPRHKRNKLYVGQRIKIPTKKGGTKNYRVKRGDNLTKIAKKFGVSSRSLRSSNRLSGSKIFIGQRLRVPTVYVDKTSYKVRSGDNLSQIARRYGTSISRLVSFNDLSSKRIYVGQKLYIPKR